ncbi:MAG: glucose 1-dehydrogenase [Arenicellales bacterium]
MQTKKTVLITGASRGIGAACARRFAREGYRVAIAYKQNHQAAEAVLEHITGLGGEVFLIQADIADPAQITEMFEQVDKQWGRLDCLVNNAGMLQQQMPVLEMSAERIDQMFITNSRSAFLCCQAAVRRMSTELGGAGGAIVNVSSIAASLGSPNEYVDYAASKAAMDTLTKGLALEVAEQGIRVNAVRPGVIDTEMHADGGEPKRLERVKAFIPMRRGGTPDEVANAVYWLASDEASFVTGSLLDVGGGR